MSLEAEFTSELEKSPNENDVLPKNISFITFTIHNRKYESYL